MPSASPLSSGLSPLPTSGTSAALRTPLGAVGAFNLAKLVARGGQGEVYLANERSTGLPVAIKTMHLPDGEVAHSRFSQESMAAGRLNHPDIVRLLAAGVEGQSEGPRRAWMAMEWVSGQDLGRTLAEVRRLPPGPTMNLGARIAGALDHAHKMGVVHRDLKPGNVLIQWHNGAVKLSDFGCAHLKDATQSRSGAMLGSLAYMAPEQLAGAPIDGRTDFFALGVLLYECLTGTRPFEAPTLGGLMAKIGRETPPTPQHLCPDIPKAASDIVMRLLAKQAADRPADGELLSRELCMIALTCWLPPPPLKPQARHNS